MRRFISSIIFVIALLTGLQNALYASSTPLQESASGTKENNPNKAATFDPLLVAEMQRDELLWGEGVVLDVDIGPNLYAYVNQNPWSKFDPKGLKEEKIGSVYVQINHKTKEYYVGETGRAPESRMNDSDHQSYKLRNKEGTIAYSRSIVADTDKPGGLSQRAQRMVVEREIHNNMSKEMDKKGYKSLNDKGSLLGDKKYETAKKNSDPRLKAGEKVQRHQAGKKNLWGNRKFSKVSGNKALSGFFGKAGGVAGLVGLGMMFANSEAIGSEIESRVRQWPGVVRGGSEAYRTGLEAKLAEDISQTNQGPSYFQALSNIMKAGDKLRDERK